MCHSKLRDLNRDSIHIPSTATHDFTLNLTPQAPMALMALQRQTDHRFGVLARQKVVSSVRLATAQTDIPTEIAETSNARNAAAALASAPNAFAALPYAFNSATRASMALRSNVEFSGARYRRASVGTAS